jgi:hypothetical protein
LLLYQRYIYRVCKRTQQDEIAMLASYTFTVDMSLKLTVH